MVMARSQKLRMARLVHLYLNLVDSREPLNILGQGSVLANINRPAGSSVHWKGKQPGHSTK